MVATQQDQPERDPRGVDEPDEVPEVRVSTSVEVDRGQESPAEDELFPPPEDEDDEDEE